MQQGPGHGSYGSPQQNNYGFTSPPPQNYGRPAPVQNRPAPMSRPPPSPAPPNGADPALWPLFKAVDKNSTSFRTFKHVKRK